MGGRWCAKEQTNKPGMKKSKLLLNKQKIKQNKKNKQKTNKKLSLSEDII